MNLLNVFLLLYHLLLSLYGLYYYYHNIYDNAYFHYNHKKNEEREEAKIFLQKKTKPQTKDLTSQETNKMMKFKKADEESSGEINPEELYYTKNENENEIGKFKCSREVSHHVFKMDKKYEDKNTQTTSSHKEEEEE